MSDTSDHLLTLDEAAALASCSTKTLYRAMAKGQLPFVRGASNRRLVRLADIQALFPYRATERARTLEGDLHWLHKQFGDICRRLDEQHALLTKAIALYQPKTWEALAKKHRGPHSAD